MKLARKIRQFLSPALLTALPASVAYAHAGHESADGIFHGVLHSEHVLILLAIAIIAVIGKIIKNR